MSGLHMGIITLMNKLGVNEFIQTIIPILYWTAVALGLTLYTRWRMKKSYDEPMRILAAATAQVARGDFSVYIPPYHTADKLDYLDVMLMDFNTMVAELGSIETLKVDFFANVSHEIKTPIAVIQNSAELLSKGNLSEENMKEYSENIRQATKKLSTLITSMLKLNKLEKQTIRPMPKVYDLSEQLCECALQFEDIWEQKNIEFIAEMDDRTMICADPELMELVWTNLLSNAIKFTSSGGNVTLHQSTNINQVIVSVSDTGCGMDAATKDHIFEKFYQGDTSHSTEGNGLGLALAFRVLQLMNSSISVESNLGAGSTFTVKIPIERTAINND